MKNLKVLCIRVCVIFIKSDIFELERLFPSLMRNASLLYYIIFHVCLLLGMRSVFLLIFLFFLVKKRSLTFYFIFSSSHRVYSITLSMWEPFNMFGSQNKLKGTEEPLKVCEVIDHTGPLFLPYIKKLIKKEIC